MSTRATFCLQDRALSLCRAVLMLGACSAALPEELPRTPACRTALQALDQAEEAMATSGAASSVTAPDRDRQRSVAVRLQPLRVRVANACLGGLTTSSPPSQHTWVVPTPARPTAAAPRTPLPGTPPVTVPLPRFDPPITVSNCNAATCLGSDGSTLTRVGPNVIGPRGVCTVQGMFLHCP
ncbi:MAG: hypothetical protein HY020_12460 [Burkholderiales bacterium]|nr:hypothetical protein [Burkholderiales bacterium]